MEPRPRGGDPQPNSGEPPQTSEPKPAGPDAPTQPVPMPWERPQTPAGEPRSTIISAEPLVSEPSAGQPEVPWAPAPPPGREVEVPGAPGFVFASTLRRFTAWLLDNFLIAIPTLVVVAVITTVAGMDYQRDSTPFNAVFNVVSVGLSVLYFVLFWTSRRRATLGMRALQLQVGTAFEGRPLPMGSALVRWALLGYPLSLLYLVGSIAGLASLVAFVWSIALLVSTIASPTKQGFHDRIAASAVVQPAGLGRSGLVVGCLVIVVGLIVLWVVLIALILLGGQMEEILREAGQSI